MIGKKTVFSLLLFSYASSLKAMELAALLAPVGETRFSVDRPYLEENALLTPDCAEPEALGAGSRNEFNDAIERGDIQRVKSLLARAAAVKAVGARAGIDRGALLDYADLKEQLEVFHCILEAMGPDEIAAYLIGKYGTASAYYKGPALSLRGPTIMHSAVIMLLMLQKSKQYENKKRLIPLLVAAGAPINEEHLETKMTPYEYTVALGNESLQELLLSNGACPRGNGGVTDFGAAPTQITDVEEALIEGDCEVRN